MLSLWHNSVICYADHFKFGTILPFVRWEENCHRFRILKWHIILGLGKICILCVMWSNQMVVVKGFFSVGSWPELGMKAFCWVMNSQNQTWGLLYSGVWFYSGKNKIGSCWAIVSECYINVTVSPRDAKCWLQSHMVWCVGNQTSRKIMSQERAK